MIMIIMSRRANKSNHQLLWKRFFLHKTIVLFYYLLFFSNYSIAAKWVFQPQLSVTESYFDNITLVSDDSNAKNKELVTQVLPGFSLSKNSRRLQMSAAYSFGYINYWSDDFSDKTYNQGNVSASTEIIRRHLYINANAAVTQQIVNPSNAFSNNVAVVSGNQTETRVIGIQPRLLNRFGAYANSELSYKHTFVNYSKSVLGNSRLSTLQYNLNSGTWFKQINWTGTATQINSSRQNRMDSSALFRVNYDLSQHWSTFFMTRARKVSYQPIGNSTSQYFINPETGVVWTISRRIKIEAGGGVVLNARDLSNRTLGVNQSTWRTVANLAPTPRTALAVGRETSLFGNRKFLDFSHNTRHTNWLSGYSEVLITPQQLRISSAVDSASSSIAGNSISSGLVLDRLVSDEVILRKRLNFNADITRRRVTVKGSVFYEKGEYQTSNLKDKRYGVSGGVDIAVGKSIKWLNQVSVQRYNFSGGDRIDNIYIVNSSIAKKINLNTNVSFAYQQQKRNSSTRNIYYTAQSIIFQLSTTF